MKNSDLLAELRANILHDRSDRTSGDSDYLWTDTTLYRYINEAQRRFARESLCLRDADNPEVTEVTLVAGQANYPLHTSIIAVLSAKMRTRDEDLVRASHIALNGHRRLDTAGFDASASSTATGEPTVYTCNDHFAQDDFGSTSRVVMRVHPIPTSAQAGEKIDLRVIRLPVEEINAVNANAHPEIPEQHHIEMLDWAAYLALRIVDIDAGAPDRAKEFKNTFAENVALARKVAIGKLFVPFMWGFGQGGYTWEK